MKFPVRETTSLSVTALGGARGLLLNISICLARIREPCLSFNSPTRKTPEARVCVCVIENAKNVLFTRLFYGLTGNFIVL